ncbi:MAG: hypothetical protein ACI955_002433 [Zhongshania sp.]|jgi:hypothetical protein
MFALIILHSKLLACAKADLNFGPIQALLYAIFTQLVNCANIEGDKSTVTALKAAVSWQN